MKQKPISRFFQPSKRPKFQPLDVQDANNPSRTPKESKEKTKLTPLETQIIQFKSQYDFILAIQVGYKYKFFGPDAAIVSQLVNIMLIPHEDSRFQYCSIPDTRLHIHLKKILEYGHKVGVIKQTQSSFEAKGLFDRQLTGIYTKATYMNEESEYSDLNDVDNGHYISGIYSHDNKVAMVSVRPVTGEIVIDEFEDNGLWQNLDTRMTYFNPSQVILIDDYQCEPLLKCYKCSIEKQEHKDEGGKVPDYLQSYSIEVQKCIGGLIAYLTPFKLDIIFTIPSNIMRFNDTNSMILPSNVIKSLEVFVNSTNDKEIGSLFWLLNQTRTKFGERLLKKWVSYPLIRKDLIQDRQNAIGDLSSGFNHFIDCLKDKLTGLMDLERALIKIYYKKITRTDVFKMLTKLNDLCQLIKQFESEIVSLSNRFKSNDLISIFTKLIDFSKDLKTSNYLKMISATHGDNQVAKDQKINYFNLDYHNWTEISGKLDEIESIKLEITDETKEVIKVIGKPIVLTKNMNQDNLVEVRNSLLSRIPSDWLRINSTKTLTRFRSPVLNKLNSKLNYANEQLESICDQCFLKFLRMINDDYFKFHQLITQLAKLDCYLSLTAVSFQYTKPTIVEDQTIEIVNFKNPIINTISNFIANDIKMNEHNRISIITGPNMGGKSSYIKSIGLLIIMNQIGCYLPCESARIGIFDRIFIRMGALDNILKGQSTFMIEMLEMLEILNNFTAKSLILLDEVGKGTGTHDGYVIAYSILKYFAQHDIKPLILFITHFPQLNELVQLDGIQAYHMDYLVQDDEVIFLYKLVEGIVNESYGLNVARLAGIPGEIIEKARGKSKELRLENDLKVFLTNRTKNSKNSAK